MKFRNLDLKKLIAYLFVAMAYPVLSCVSSADNRLLRLINGMTICALVFIILGMFNLLVLHGDFDITAFVATRFFYRDKAKNYEAYKSDRDDDRKQGFNYPLFVGLLMLIASVILTVYVY